MYRKLVNPVRKQLDYDEYQEHYRKLKKKGVRFKDVSEWKDYGDWEVRTISEINRYWNLGAKSFNRHIKRDDLVRLIKDYLVKDDGSSYTDEELSGLTKVQLWMMFKKYKPIQFGRAKYR